MSPPLAAKFPDHPNTTSCTFSKSLMLRDQSIEQETHGSVRVSCVSVSGQIAEVTVTET